MFSKNARPAGSNAAVTPQPVAGRPAEITPARVARRREGGGALGLPVRLRTARRGVGEGGPCVSVLLFRGGGGGDKMAAHGGSAASSALKGLIQQFTAITGKRRGYGKVIAGWGGGGSEGCRGCPRLHLTFMPSSLGLSPQLLSSPEEQATAAPGSAVQAGGSFPPPRVPPRPSIRSPLSSQTGPHAPCQPRAGDGPSPRCPRPGTCGREE